MQYTPRIKFFIKKKNQLRLQNEKYLICSLPLIAVIKAALLFTDTCFFLIAHSPRSEIFSQLNQGRIAPKSHQPMPRKASCIGLGEKEELACVWLLPLPSFLERVLFMQPQVGWKREGTGPDLDLGNHCNTAFVCHFLIPIFSFALPKFQHG